MTPPGRGRAFTALLGGSVLGAAAPGVLPTGGALLLAPALMVQFALLQSARPLRDAYLFGAASFAWFSWSIHHVAWGAWIAIVAVGGIYFALAAAAARSVGRGCFGAFAVAAAGAVWLRSVMPEILYPHGQPVHSLAAAPSLLGAVVLGGEPLGNALLAGLSAAAVQLWRSYRLANEPFGRAATRLLGCLTVAVAATWGGNALRPAPSAVTSAVELVLVEPGMHPLDPFVGLADDAVLRRLDELIAQRLVAPTRDALAGAAAPPDLVLWPESALPLTYLPLEDVLAGRASIGATGFGRAPTRLLLGAGLRQGDRRRVAAVLVELPTGRVLAHQEKRCLVPGGEFLPFANWLPRGLAAVVLGWFEAALGSPPDLDRGEPRPLLRTAAGVPFGALICYDNAFPEAAADLVAAGAQFLVVLSNEAWYRGGAELEQLLAMTSCRAVELGVPVVRCTTDGRTAVVDRDGRVVQELAPASAPTPAARILRVRLAVGSVAVGALARLRAATGPAVGVGLALLLLHSFVRWARLRVARTAT